MKRFLRPRSAALLPLLLIMAASIWFCTPLVFGPVPEQGGGVRWRFHNLLFDSHERLHYVIRLSELDDSLRHGMWDGRWSRNLEGGYGYPFFNFYAPLSYYLAELWHLLGLDLFLSWKLHFLLMTALSGAGVYAYARLFYRRTPSTVAALFYLLAPYHVVNLYVRGNVAEFTAMTVLPWLLFFLHRLIRSGRRSLRDLLGTTLASAALILTHNLTAFFAGLFLAGYCAVWLLRLKREFPFWTVMLAGGCGVLLSGVFWVPMLFEMRFTHFEVMKHTFLAAPRHTVSWSQFFQNTWGFGDSVPGPADQLSFSLGWPQWAALFGTLFFLFRNRIRDDRAFLAVVSIAGLFIVLLLVSGLGAPFWKLRVFSTIQFPWRLLSLASLCAAIGSAWFVESLGNWRRGADGWGALALLLTLVVVSAPKIRVLSYFPHQASLYRPENTRRTFTNTNIGEFRPVWVSEFPTDRDGEPVLSRRRVLDDSGSTIHVAHPDVVTDLKFRYSGRGGETLTYEVFFFPGWKAEVDGKVLDAGPVISSGMIAIQALPGSHIYRIHFGRSPARVAGLAFSWIGILILGLMCVYARRSRPGLPEELAGDAGF